MVRRTLWTVAFTSIAFACEVSSEPDLTAPPLSAEIVDAAHNGGREGFYFLPPLVPDPNASGTFDPAFLPFLTVEICEWSGTDCVLPSTQRFTSHGESSSETLRIGDDGEHYIVNWHTDQSGLDPEKDYRIRVLAGELDLGHADVDVVSSGKELKNIDTGQYIALKDGRTLPIKFSVSENVVPPGAIIGSVALSAGPEPSTLSVLSLDEEVGVAGSGAFVLPEASDAFPKPLLVVTEGDVTLGLVHLLSPPPPLGRPHCSIIVERRRYRNQHRW